MGWGREKQGVLLKGDSFLGDGKVLKTVVMAAQQCESGINATEINTLKWIWWQILHFTYFIKHSNCHEIFPCEATDKF